MDFKAVSGCVRTTREIVAASEGGDPNAIAAIERFEDRLARGLSVIINIFDLDAIVVGGGVSNLDRLYRSVPGKLSTYVFGREASTPVLKAIHGIRADFIGPHGFGLRSVSTFRNLGDE